MKKIIATCCILCMFFIIHPVYAIAQKWRYEFFDTFDTLITIIAYHESESVFTEHAKEVHKLYQLYHKYFDIHNEYDGLVNLATLNRLAYSEAQKVDEVLFTFLKYIKQLQEKYPGAVNIALGNVLKVWHDYREQALSDAAFAKLPSAEELHIAATYTSIDNMILDEQTQTVSFDAPIRLDAGAIAKGYTTELVAQYLENSNLTSFIINAGGNIRTGGKPLDERAYWGVGIADPTNPNQLYDTVYIRESSLVTSGDYQRFYVVDGVRVHHIIDPVTLYPANRFRSVSIFTKDSGIADFLSTALFILSYEEGMALLEHFPDSGAMWIDADGKSISSPLFETIQKSKEASSLTERP